MRSIALVTMIFLPGTFFAVSPIRQSQSNARVPASWISDGIRLRRVCFLCHFSTGLMETEEASPKCLRMFGSTLLSLYSRRGSPLGCGTTSTSGGCQGQDSRTTPSQKSTLWFDKRRGIYRSRDTYFTHYFSNIR